MPDPSPPPVGELNLYSSVRPPLSAGGYTVRLEQAISDAGTVAPVDRQVEVTAPRFTLPGTEVHSVFPPPNARGPFENRLAQIALSRRTLPWERAANDEPVASRPPWLALVLLTDGEANFLSGVSIADAMSEAVRTKLGVKETGTCDALEVSTKVINAVFPREDELELLAHVRQVNMADTEYAGSDDDGFVAILLSNRLPQPGQRYGAYLLSLEGQLDELPGGATPAAEAAAPSRATPLADAVYEVGGTRVYELTDEQLTAATYERTGNTVSLADSQQPSLTGGATSATSSPWNTGPTTADGAPIEMAIADLGQGLLLNTMDFEVLHTVVQEPPPRLVRFPVLAHWRFECSGDGDFQTLMQKLDVGLLGTPPRRGDWEDEDRQFSFDSTDTGHTIVDHLTRRGDQAQAWYRGPFAPRQVARSADPRPYHVADQARRIGADGREDISEAAAFELGRLLALSSGEFAAALQSWRRAGIAARRVASAAQELPQTIRAAATDAGVRVMRTLGIELVAQAATTLGDPVPVDDPGTTELLSDGDAAAIAEGLDLPQALVTDALETGVTQQPFERNRFERRLETTFDKVAAKTEDLRRSLGVALDRRVTQTLSDATRPPEPDPLLEPTDPQRQGSG